MEVINVFHTCLGEMTIDLSLFPSMYWSSVQKGVIIQHRTLIETGKHRGPVEIAYQLLDLHTIGVVGILYNQGMQVPFVLKTGH